MSEAQRLQQQIDERKQRWDTLSGVIVKLQKDGDLETRADEKIRLADKLDHHKSEREQLGNELKSLEEKGRKLQIAQEKQEALRREKNRAFKEALEVWERILTLDPHDTEADYQIERLQQRLWQSQRVDEYRKQLAGRYADIQSVYPQVIKRLRQMMETENKDDAIVWIVEEFLQNNLSLEDFLKACEDRKSDTVSAPAADRLDYRALADRLKRGEIVLFLGSDIPRLLDIEAPDPETIVPLLARQINYDSFAGPLSKISEYYLLKQEYGRSSLVRRLHELLQPTHPKVPFYSLLARIEQPLVLISATYDLFLEQIFREHDKKYALISSIVFGEPEELGKVFLRCSDDGFSERLYSEEELSGLKLIDEGYSLIYKIRGFCDTHHRPSNLQESTMTLCEHNYFTFARYFDKLIPSYIIRELARRGLFFVGYSLRHWEDRLLAYAIFDKRPTQYEFPCVITEDKDPFIRAYWDSPKVKKYEIGLKDFVGKLEEFVK